VLLLEDDDAVRAATLRLLESLGCSTVAARLPSEALEILRERGSLFKLVLTDMVMPEMSGAQFAHLISEKYPHLKIVVMSGYAEESTDSHWRLPRGAAFLEKPLTRTSLVRKISEVLD
jgi:CheY-like chemotaxis protein